MKKALLLVLALSACANPRPYSWEQFTEICSDPATVGYTFGLQGCGQYHADQANFVHRMSPEYRAQQAQGALAAALVLGAASDAIWMSSLPRHYHSHHYHRHYRR